MLKDGKKYKNGYGESGTITLIADRDSSDAYPFLFKLDDDYRSYTVTRDGKEFTSNSYQERRNIVIPKNEADKLQVGLYGFIRLNHNAVQIREIQEIYIPKDKQKIVFNLRCGNDVSVAVEDEDELNKYLSQLGIQYAD